MRRKLGTEPLSLGGVELGPHLTQFRLAYLRTKWRLDPSSRLATIDMAENWGLCPFGGGGAGSPSNTMWPGPRPICMPSFILIYPTVWPQYTNVTDRQDRDRQTGQTTV